MAILAIDIMKNHIRHRLYPQKIAENEEGKQTEDWGTEEHPLGINKDGITLRGAILFALASSNLLSPWDRLIFVHIYLNYLFDY